MSKRTLPSNWSRIKKLWREVNPPDENGNYICWLCKEAVPAASMTLDHVAPLAEYPEYGAELSNLRPTHRWCNEERAANTLGRLRGRKILKRMNHNKPQSRVQHKD